MPKPGYHALTVDRHTYREATRIAEEMQCSRAEVLRRAVAAIDHHGEWGTVRQGADVIVCRIGSPAWEMGSFRVLAVGGRESAEKAREERVRYLTAHTR